MSYRPATGPATGQKNLVTDVIDNRSSDMFTLYRFNRRFGSEKEARGAACMREATVLVHKGKNMLRLALHHDSNNALILSGCNFIAPNLLLVSDKQNACPFALVQNKTDSGQTATILWHIAYKDLHPSPHGEANKIDSKLPKLVIDDPRQKLPSLHEAFTSPTASVLVTDPALLDESTFSFKGTRSLLMLPRDLLINSSGLEHNIRSYSVNYFPFHDILILSGHNLKDQPTLWVMYNPFTESKRTWHKIPGREFIEAMSHQEQKPFSTLDVIKALSQPPGSSTSAAAHGLFSSSANSEGGGGGGAAATEEEAAAAAATEAAAAATEAAAAATEAAAAAPAPASTT